MLFTYTNSKGQQQSVTLDDDQSNLYIQAKRDYETSRSYILSQAYYIWRYGYKAYHLSTKDRSARINKTQTNFAFGFTRSFVDVFASSLSERPIVWTAKAYDEQALNNKENVVDYLSIVSDMTKFNREAKKILAEGLKTGMFCVRVSYLPPAKPIKYRYIYNNKVFENEFTPEVGDVPYAQHVDVFKIFPDPGTGNMSYVVERDVVTIDVALKMFIGLIQHKSNKSPFKSDEFIKNITLNTNGACFDDYSSVRTEVHEEKNSKFQSVDTTDVTRQSTATIRTRPDQDKELNKNRIEYRYCVYDSYIVLTFNDYPVYIGDNIFGFINYVIKNTSNADVRIGVEGVPYLLADMEAAINGHMNAYFDNVLSVARPNFIFRKGAVLDESALKYLEPGQGIAIDGDVGENTIRRLEKGTVSDFNVLDICSRIAQQLTGISEYNLGVSARERTATGANATSQSSQKRLSPFLESYMIVVSEIARMQIKMAIKFYQKSKKFVLNDLITQFKSKDFVGLMDITMELDSIVAAQDELKNKRLMEIFNMAKGSGLLNEDELMKKIIENQGVSPSTIVPDTAPKVTQQNQSLPTPQSLPEEPTPNNAELPTELRELSTPQLNLQG